jgi:hypothetical protein
LFHLVILPGLVFEDRTHRLNWNGDFFYPDRYLKLDNTAMSPNEADRGGIRHSDPQADPARFVLKSFLSPIQARPPSRRGRERNWMASSVIAPLPVSAKCSAGLDSRVVMGASLLHKHS